MNILIFFKFKNFNLCHNLKAFKTIQFLIIKFQFCEFTYSFSGKYSKFIFGLQPPTQKRKTRRRKTLFSTKKKIKK